MKKERGHFLKRGCIFFLRCRILASLAGLSCKELATLGIPSVDSITTEAGIPAIDYILAASVCSAIFS
jgi:hypothetical protein